MAGSWLIDSNILLRLSRRADPLHLVVANAVRRLLADEARLCYTHQNIAEFWNVWTRPAERNGFGLTGVSAAIEVAKFGQMMTLAADGPAVYRKWLQLVGEHRVTGVQVHDARLVAVMAVHEIPSILTLNATDFARYNGIVTAVHPSSLDAYC